MHSVRTGDARAPTAAGLALGIAGLACAGFFVACAARWAAYPYDLAPGEGDSLHLALRLLGGEPIYTPETGFPYLYNVYPPLYPLLVAAGVWLAGPDLLIPRLLSIAAALGLAALAARWLGAAGAPREWQIAAGAGAIGAPVAFIWLVICRADALSTLLACGCLVLAERQASRRDAPLAGLVVLGLLACFTRQSNALLVAAAFLALWPERRWRALFGLAACGGLGLAGLLAIDAWTDGAFWRSLLAPVAWSDWATYKAVHWGLYAQSQMVWLAWFLAALLVPRLRAAVPGAAWLGAGIGGYLMSQVLRVGAATNWFLPGHFFVVAIGVRAAWRATACWPRARVLAPLSIAVQLGLNCVQLAGLAGVVSPQGLDAIVRLERHLKTQQGPLLLDRQVALWLYLGRRDHFVEVAGLALDAHHGRWRPQPLLEFVDRAGYAAILLRRATLMPEAVQQRIRERYRAESTIYLFDDAYTLYKPKAPPAGPP